MKKKLLFSILFFVITVSGFAQFEIPTDPETFIQQLNDQLLKKHNHNQVLTALDADDLLIALRADSYDFDVEMWEGVDSTVFVYDSENRLIETLAKQENNGIWQDSRRTFNTYDDDGNLTIRLTEIWDGFEWQINARETNEYDANGRPTLQVFEVPGTIPTEWVNFYRVAMVWGTEGEQLERVFDLWDTDLGEWIPENRTHFEYNNEVQVLNIFYENWDNGAWINNIRDTYSYNNDGLQESFLKEEWDGVQWQNFNLFTNQYDAEDRLLGTLIQFWEDNEWLNQSRSFLEYQEDGFISYSLIENWIGGEWVNNLQQISEYDEEGNNTNYIIQLWDDVNENWVDNFRIYFYYQIVTDIEELLNLKPQLDIFPNPGTGLFNIEYNDWNAPDNKSLEVYNTLGQLVHSENLTSNSLNLSHLSEGNYVIRLIDADSSESRKVQIIK